MQQTAIGGEAGLKQKTARVCRADIERGNHMNVEKGLYMASITEKGAKTMHASEDAVCDAQIGKMFQQQGKERKTQEKTASDDLRKAERQAAMKKRRRCCMIKDVAGMLVAAALVYMTYTFGLSVAIAGITGCIVAAGCRIVGYMDAGREAYV